MSFFKSKHLIFFLLLLTTYFTFTSKKPIEISYFDDNRLILENETFLKTAPFSSIWSRNVFISKAVPSPYYRPLLTLSFMIDARRALFSFDTFFATNLFLHLFNLCLFYLIITKLSVSTALNILFTSILAFHPFLAMTVAWIPGRNDLLLASFSLLATLFLQLYHKSFQSPTFFLHLLFFVLALLTKETALVLPIIWILFGFINKKVFYYWLSICLLYLIFFVSTVSSVAKINFFYTIPALISFLGFFTFPFNLPLLPALVDVSMLVWIFGLILIYFMLRLRYFHELLVFFTLVLPTLFSLTNSQSFLLLHRLYLPIIFSFLLLSRRQFKISFYWLVLIPPVYLVLLIIQLDLLKTSTNFWYAASRLSPHVAAIWVNKAAVDLKNNQLAQAETSLNNALFLDDKVKYLNANFALLNREKQDLSLARQFAQKEITLNPTAESLFLLGSLEAMMHNNPAAEIAFKQALNLDPQHSQSLIGLIQVLFNQNKTEEAEAYLKQGKKLGLEIQVNP